MAVAPTPVGQWFTPSGAARFVTGRGGLWLAFAAVHVLVCALALLGAGMPLGDVTLVYKFWAQQAIADHYVVGIDSGWVYPIVALIPILAASVFGFALYDFTWLAIVVALNAAAFAVLVTRDNPVRRRAAWWWLAFLVLLGPIAVGRIDAITVPLVVVALLWLAERPPVAGVLLAAAMWVKVWPAAIIAAVVIAAKQRWQVLVAAAATSAGIIVVALLLGAGANIMSFITQQTGRGLQIEAPVSSIWLWLGALGQPASGLYYDNELLTFQVVGPGVKSAAALMTPLMGIAVLVVLAVGVRAALRRGAWNRAGQFGVGQGRAVFGRPVQGGAAASVLPILALALVAALIAFNKVGSPQFVTWLSVPVIAGLVLDPRRFAVPAVLVALVAALTQVVYPYWYGYLLNLDAPMVAVLTVRNALYFVLVGWALQALWRMPSGQVLSGETEVASAEAK